MGIGIGSEDRSLSKRKFRSLLAWGESVAFTTYTPTYPTCRKPVQLEAQTSINPTIPFTRPLLLLLLLILLTLCIHPSLKIPNKQNDVSHLQLRMPATVETSMLALLRNGKSRKDIVLQKSCRLLRKLLLPETPVDPCRPSSSAEDRRATAMLPREAFKYVRIREA